MRWSASTTLPGQNTQRPELAVGEGVVYAFGDPWTLPSGGMSALVALHQGMDPLPPPPGAIGFFEPVLAVDRAGTLHVLWGEHAPGREPEPVTGGVGRRSPVRLGRVMYARHQQGRWSTAEVVYDAPVVVWIRPAMARLEVDSSGTLHFAFGAERAAANVVLVHLRRGPEGWQATEFEALPLGPVASGSADDSLVPFSAGFYPRLAVRGERVYLGFVTAARLASGGWPPGGDSNSLWIRRSDDAGRTWGAPVLVNRSGMLRGLEPQMVAVGHDTVHLLWHKELDRKPGPDAVRHAMSTDGGATWGEPVDVRPPGPFPLRNLRAVGRLNGELLIAFASLAPVSIPSDEPVANARAERFFYARWGPAGWSRPHQLREEREGRFFDLVGDVADRLHLLWSDVERGVVSENDVRMPIRYAVGSVCGAYPG